MKEELEPFPDVMDANAEGLLAIGGDLSVDRLILAYSNGIFPWSNANEPILWWSPDPRMVLYPNELIISASMKKVMLKTPFSFTMDSAFDKVIEQCGTSSRKGQNGTWITADMIEAYIKLFELGYAHSVEVWIGSDLVGGLYGVALGKAFFGESMFYKVDNASKAGFIKFTQWGQEQGIEMIDCQVPTEHLASLGARKIPRSRFISELNVLIEMPDLESWKF